MKILGIDPGTSKSGVVMWDTQTNSYDIAGVYENEELLRFLSKSLAKNKPDLVVIEMVSSYGQRVGLTVFETILWIGRFEMTIRIHWNIQVELVTRKECVTHFCEGKDKNDAVLRHVMIARFGGDDKAIGAKKCPTCKGKGWVGTGRPTCTTCNGGKWAIPPGPLKGITTHMWPALGLCMYAIDKKLNKEE